MKVGYQGIEGAYSEVALLNHFGKEVSAVSFDTFEDVFEALDVKKIDAAILPFENSISGSITRNYDLLFSHKNASIVAEHKLPINHCLLSSKDTSLDKIQKVFSHPTALEQCHHFLTSKSMKQLAEYDTAGSAKLVSTRGKEDEAAIASELCAEIYNLQVLQKDIQSTDQNFTKFFVLRKTEDVPSDQVKEKTSIVFKTKHYPGALVNCLQRLAKNDVNLTKLESRPVPDNPGEYVFYTDFIGGSEDENVKLALTEMDASSEFLRVLGSYPLRK